MTDYLEEKRKTAYDSLQIEYSYRAWLELREMIFLLLQIFNRRRQGKISKAEIEEFKKCTSIDGQTNKDTFNSLNEKCKDLARTFFHFQIHGKLQRTVPVLVHKGIYESLQLFLDLRGTAGVSPENQFIFGLPGLTDKRERRLHAYAVMSKHSVLCGADDPSSLRGTNLRKHIATLLAEYNFYDSDLTDSANFLGHEEKIHKSHYCQRTNREILVVSQFLERGSKPLNPRTDLSDISENNSQQNSTIDSVEETHVRKRCATESLSPEISIKKQKISRQNPKKIDKSKKKLFNEKRGLRRKKIY
ncbi:uncharacterized protein LOC130677185 [Microplitis mediator]|uniref:uncharacterized protein LOC130677185 n=1 Tax=Microplitis mediator TaxID=375433 RepID=UPI0025534941|nr:uncharacterized protein LOC130677185 [Microplitis mediator]